MTKASKLPPHRFRQLSIDYWLSESNKSKGVVLDTFVEETGYERVWASKVLAKQSKITNSGVVYSPKSRTDIQNHRSAMMLLAVCDETRRFISLTRRESLKEKPGWRLKQHLAALCKEHNRLMDENKDLKRRIKQLEAQEAELGE